MKVTALLRDESGCDFRYGDSAFVDVGESVIASAGESANAGVMSV